MLDLYDTIETYRNWSGGKEDFLKAIEEMEREDPTKRMLVSKKAPYNSLPVNMRRIQWFISNRIIPKAMSKKFEFKHIVFYWLAINLRKQKVTFKQLENLIDQISVETACQILAKEGQETQFLKLGKDLLDNLLQDEIALGLKRLGRPEGRALKSNLVRLAITPWCHVTLNEKELSDLTEEDADILASAFRQALGRVIL